MSIVLCNTGQAYLRVIKCGVELVGTNVKEQQATVETARCDNIGSSGVRECLDVVVVLQHAVSTASEQGPG